MIKITNKGYPQGIPLNAIKLSSINTMESEGFASAGSGVNSPFPIKTLSLMALIEPSGYPRH